jgi:drug/metabolite transporter (DMT)-like permease
MIEKAMSKGIKRSKAALLFTVLFTVLGIYLTLKAGLTETANPAALFAVLGAIFLALGGLFAQAWAKYQEEGK